jgi:hypothetical protein
MGSQHNLRGNQNFICWGVSALASSHRLADNIVQEIQEKIASLLDNSDLDQK